MKKWIILLLIVVVVCFSGCAKDEDVSSLNEYEMVYLNEKKVLPV